MALIDVIKCDVLVGNDWLVWKHPHGDLRLGTQLIVNNNQRAVFVKGGQVCDFFEAGTHTLNTKNIPILGKFLNEAVFGGKTPFSAEIWYFNLSDKRNQKWGTPSPIRVMDPKLDYPLTIRSFGDWGYRLADPSALYNRLIGTIEHFNAELLDEQFKGLILQRFTSCTNKFLIHKQLSVYDINAYLDDLASEITSSLRDEFSDYGIDITNVNVRNINIPEENNAAVEAIKKEKMRVSQLGQVHASDTYKSVRSFDVMDNISQNEGSMGGMMSNAIGLGAGLGVGTNLGNQMSAQINQSTQSGMVASGSESIEDKLLKLKRLLDMGMINQGDFDMKKQKLLDDFLGI